jgi:NADPH-dependent stearoyl-CoA 9-desaturase
MDSDGFARAIDTIRKRVEAELGDEDVSYIRRVDAVSRALEVVGRSLIHVSVEPIGFTTGVACLWLHKQLQATEIGHHALHGAYDRLPGAERYHSTTFRWRMPLDEELWRELHNARHHPYTNIIGRDPGVGALPINDALPTRELARRAARKAIPYYAREYVLFPALAGPFWWKVLLGNFLSELARDVYSAAALYTGHDGHDVAYFPPGTRARDRAEWYRMQVEATNNFEVGRLRSILCGALELHIEHHLFPKLPPNRLRQIAPEVKRACAAFGMPYKTDSWARTLRKVFRQLRAQRLSAVQEYSPNAINERRHETTIGPPPRT